MNRRSTTTRGLEQDELLQEVENLREEVRVLRDAIDELRELFEYVTNNGVPIRSEMPFGVVKQMALDPCDPEWGERLVVVRTQEDADAWNEQLAEREGDVAESQPSERSENSSRHDGMLF